jgi:predicted small metal-binding protein
MNGAEPAPSLSLACRDLGLPCEWAVRSSSDAEIRSRFAEHAKCAHAMDVVVPDVAERVAKAMRHRA